MMVHDLVGEQKDSWYCSFSKAGAWKLDRCKGTSRAVMEFFRNRGQGIDLGFGVPCEELEKAVGAVD